MVTGEHAVSEQAAPEPAAHARGMAFPLKMAIGGAILAGVFGLLVAVATGEPSFLLLILVGAATGWTIASFASIEVDRTDEPDQSHAH
ncbi:MAG TPA: hypothetical protein VFL91_02560 [Thermomicrobiales bacterium]|nr:hypothetical protein [Thermomicrobiales bacterium]